MREIKFRVYDNHTKKMFDNIHIKLWNSRIEYIQIDIQNGSMMSCGSFLDEKRYNLMQFTGLKDKNGKEIHEGDIVAIQGKEYYSNDSISLDDIKGAWKFVGKVELNSFMWLVSDVVRDWIPFCDVLRNDFEVEIIGNIYENKELLQ